MDVEQLELGAFAHPVDMAGQELDRIDRVFRAVCREEYFHGGDCTHEASQASGPRGSRVKATETM
jgi:hypothetical protein